MSSTITGHFTAIREALQLAHDCLFGLIDSEEAEANAAARTIEAVDSLAKVETRLRATERDLAAERARTEAVEASRDLRTLPIITDTPDEIRDVEQRIKKLALTNITVYAAWELYRNRQATLLRALMVGMESMAEERVRLDGLIERTVGTSMLSMVVTCDAERDRADAATKERDAYANTLRALYDVAGGDKGAFDVARADELARAAVLKLAERTDKAAAAATDADRVVERLSSVLTEVDAALKGEPPPDTLHDWSDLPKQATLLTVQLSATQSVLDGMRACVALNIERRWRPTRALFLGLHSAEGVDAEARELAFKLFWVEAAESVAHWKRLDAAEARVEELTRAGMAWSTALMEERTEDLALLDWALSWIQHAHAGSTCAFCLPLAGRDAEETTRIQAHIRECEKHPYAAIVEQNATLSSQLAERETEAAVMRAELLLITTKEPERESPSDAVLDAHTPEKCEECRQYAGHPIMHGRCDGFHREFHRVDRVNRERRIAHAGTLRGIASRALDASDAGQPLLDAIAPQTGETLVAAVERLKREAHNGHAAERALVTGVRDAAAGIPAKGPFDADWHHWYMRGYEGRRLLQESRTVEAALAAVRRTGESRASAIARIATADAMARIATIESNLLHAPRAALDELNARGAHDCAGWDCARCVSPGVRSDLESAIEQAEAAVTQPVAVEPKGESHE